MADPRPDLTAVLLMADAASGLVTRRADGAAPAAEDATRPAIGPAASSMPALGRGRLPGAPAGMPTMLGTFGFHDRGQRGGGNESGDRVALIAFDSEALRSSWQTVPGAELAVRI